MHPHSHAEGLFMFSFMSYNTDKWHFQVLWLQPSNLPITLIKTAVVGEMYPQIQNQPNKDPFWIKMSVWSHKTKWNTVNSVWEDHPCPLMIHVSVQTSLLSLTNQCCCRYLLITDPSDSQHRNCFFIDTWNSLMDNGKKKQTQHCRCLIKSLDWVHSNEWSWFSWYQHFFST